MRRKLFPIIIAAIGVLCLFEGDFGNFIIFLMLAVGGWLIYSGFKGRTGSRKKEDVPFLTKEKEAYYKQNGMSESEIELFRETMNLSKQQVLRLQQNVQKSAKLKAIDLRHDTLKAAKALFKELVKEPTRLPEASQFLYTHLPNIVDLTDHYVEINSHEVKSKEVYGKLEESAQIIDQMADLIVKDYQQFVSGDLEDMDVELSIAKKNLDHDPDLSTK
ncbi:MAG: 5-bromo-4-chloroindolyl phosphate hydrolysis family protein [Enterococcus viikkiensis]|uniref:5-bromo-4-chloroindolyl phosphate hydrolysis family protein n=1 Tax=Enterococcus viikkiensis TaxID=930854 RepID=A0ABU3FQX8_9ENTE|nr:5-bromo-4-chloroindolyl phosphate hydrolysis family protein [Enterococcus viikkiensis]MDT2828392.1 5-bromo-4-chloroindolyl phosphate hydrolysis family protein [Enterococcus viikkiensis]